MPLLDLDALDRAPLARAPFDHLVVPNVLAPGAGAAIRAGFPRLALPGLFPVDDVWAGPTFRRLIDEIRSPEVARAFGAKFGLDLAHRPLMITVRGRCRARDGRIHTDSADKILTALLYFNEGWDDAGGRLRLLRGPGDIEDYFAEVPPLDGTLVAFRRTGNSWHGHRPYEGERRYVMLNWMTRPAAALREVARHRLSAFAKRLTHRYVPGPR